MDKHTIANLANDVERENRFFKNKDSLDIFVKTDSILGRDDKAKELIRFLLSYRYGHVIPFVSVYGRSGSGKSAVVKYVCENLPEIQTCFVNLRKAKTIFGCANLILSHLGEVPLKSAQGLNFAIEKITHIISESLSMSKKACFVLILDEFDSIFTDKRGLPSEFIYKLVNMEEKLRENNHKMCMIGISNNVVSEYDLDDRVLSRIGTSEIFFDAYSHNDILNILKDRAKKAFLKNVSKDVLQYCAQLSSQQHGDARRAIELLRLAGETAGKKEEPLSKKHVDVASEQIQQDRIANVLQHASYHLRVVCAAVIRLTYLSDSEWNSTSLIFDEYKSLLEKETRPLSYRRISGLLMDLKNTGILESHTGSKGRGGYGTQFKPTVAPEIIGRTCFSDWWESVVKSKEFIHETEKLRSIYTKRGRKNGLWNSDLF